MKTNFLATVLVLCALVFAGCGGEDKPQQAAQSATSASNRAASDADSSAAAPDRVTLQLNWYPEAEHGGFYAALVHGYYAEEGLEVEILGGGIDVPVVPLTATGKVDFGICNADEVILGRAAEANVVALMAPIQTSPRCIMVHAESGFEDFSDIRDITLAMSPRSPFAHFLRANYDFEGVRLVGYAGVQPFAAQKDYAMQGYNFSEPFVAKTLGAHPDILMVADAGFNPYTSVLITADGYLAANADIARRMVRASVRGWQKYLAEPEETNAYIHSLNEEMGLDILDFGVEQLRPLCEVEAETTPYEKMGHMTDARWSEIAAQLVELELVETEAVEASAAYRLDFLAE